MSEQFVIAGGIPRKYGELLSAGHVLKKAEIAEIDFAAKTYTARLTYETPAEYCTNKLPSIGFTSFSLQDDGLYIGTSTEAMVLDKNSYEVSKMINDPLFNDVHHVKKIGDRIFVVVTGMDAVFEFDNKGKRHNIYNVLGKDAFHRFSESDNLNKIATTKPHESHPNHVFSINNEIWITRFKQKDAICLADSSKKMNIEIGFPHDGFVKGDLVYFTTVNGYVIAFNKNTYKKELEIKLTGANNDEDVPLGWCRGLYVDENVMYVGFTQLRTTKVTENLAWLKTMVKKKKVTSKPSPTRIEKYDLTGNYLSEYVLPSDGIFTIFGIEKI